MMRGLLLIGFLFWSAQAQAKVLDIQDIVTPKGIHIWLVEDHSLPITTMSFAFHTGAVTDPAHQQGISQLLSNTLDEGAGALTSEEFQAALRDNAISLSYSSARDYFAGDWSTLTRHRARAIELLKLSVNSPRFDAEPVERMKQANLMRIRSSMTDGDWIAARIENDRVYAGHSYALNTGGTLASMEGFTPNDLRAAYKRHFLRDRLVVGVAGDIDKAQAIALVDDVFGVLPESTNTNKIENSEMKPAGKPVFFAKDMPQTSLSLVWQGISANDPDHYAAVVMDYIYGGGGFSSLLMNEVREKRGLTYGIGSSMRNLDHADRFEVSAGMQPQNVKPALDMILSIARDLQEKDVSPDMLAAAQDYLTGSLPLHFSSTDKISDTLTSLQLVGRPITALDEYRAKIRAVTQADIKRVATRIFAQKPQVFLVGAKPEGIDVETLTILPNTEGQKAP